MKDWLAIGDFIDLGGRQLEIIHTPGHSKDSISLFDAAANLLFAADFVYPGALYAQIPGADLADYLATARRLEARLPDSVQIVCAHGDPGDPAGHRAPQMLKRDIQDLAQCLELLKQSGIRPSSAKANERMSLLLGELAFASWQST